MPVLTWNPPGQGRYETGIDRGVIYTPNYGGISWDGLVSVSESRSPNRESHYQDGVKYFERVSPGDYAARIQAFTYPDIMDMLCGVQPGAHDVWVHDQAFTPFNLSYRTGIGNGIEGLAHGYKLHLVFNVTAIPSDVAYSSVAEQVQPTMFEWTVSGIPLPIPASRPTCHISFKSTNTDPAVMQFVEDQLYGTDETIPSLQSPTELLNALNTQFGG